MKTLILAAIRCSLMFTAVAALSFAHPASVQAVPTTYKYTGNPFTTATASYTTSDFVTALVTLADPLAPNMPLTIVTPLAFSFSDGVQTITDLNVMSTSIRFETGQTGVITEWEIQVISGFGVVRTTNTPPLGDVVDVGAMGPAQGFNLGAPGEWVLSSVPDVGSTLALLFLSLMALGVAARQFKRAAA
jgi:hypothetical protein